MIFGNLDVESQLPERVLGSSHADQANKSLFDSGIRQRGDQGRSFDHGIQQGLKVKDFVLWWPCINGSFLINDFRANLMHLQAYFWRFCDGVDGFVVRVENIDEVKRQSWIPVHKLLFIFFKFAVMCGKIIKFQQQESFAFVAKRPRVAELASPLMLKSSKKFFFQCFQCFLIWDADLTIRVILSARAIHLALLCVQAHDEILMNMSFLLQKKQNSLFSL